MTKKNTLGAVPDSSMLTLFRSIVGFLDEEANGRGWHDVSERLKAVERALAGHRDQDPKAP